MAARTRRWLLVGLLAGLMGAGEAAAQTVPVSEAETLLFLTDHLRNVAPPTKLSYRFQKSGSAEPGFDDAVELRVSGDDGGKRVRVHFLSKERNVEYPEVTRAMGNPVLLYFLEHDIREMERLTGGKSGYFRKAIRMALAQSANVAKTHVSVGGKERPATEITIAPYVNDPLKDRIGKYASKTYVFTLSPDVPGGVLDMRTVVSPPAVANAPPLIEERLTFVRVSKGT